MTATQRIICICSGNICRSPMAVALLREKLRRREQKAVVISAGTLGLQGRRAAEFARQAIAEMGPDLAAHIDEHRSQATSPALLEMADHLIIMSPRHERFILQMNPALAARLVRLWEFCDDKTQAQGIIDPVGKGLREFQICRDLIDQSLNAWLDE